MGARGVTERCDFCNWQAIKTYELAGKAGTGRMLRACRRHRRTAERMAAGFVPSSRGSLADDLRREERAA